MLASDIHQRQSRRVTNYEISKVIQFKNETGFID